MWSLSKLSRTLTDNVKYFQKIKWEIIFEKIAFYEISPDFESENGLILTEDSRIEYEGF